MERGQHAGLALAGDLDLCRQTQKVLFAKKFTHPGQLPPDPVRGSAASRCLPVWAAMAVALRRMGHLRMAVCLMVVVPIRAISTSPLLWGWLPFVFKQAAVAFCRRLPHSRLGLSLPNPIPPICARTSPTPPPAATSSRIRLWPSSKIQRLTLWGDLGGLDQTDPLHCG